MEQYREIDMENFERADYFQYFMSVGTTIESTVKIDVTCAIKKCKSESIDFQAYILFKLYKAMNAIENFKYDVVDGKLIQWEQIVPTFSSFNFLTGCRRNWIWNKFSESRFSCVKGR